MDNEGHKDLWSKFIVPDTPFTTSPYRDKVMAAECLKSVKSADHSRIQALFLDVVIPLTGFVDSINKEDEVVVEDLEAPVRVALTFLGNASAHCNADRRSAILEEYNKDLVSFGQDLDLFSSATDTLFGPRESYETPNPTQDPPASSPQKSNQGFSKATSHYIQSSKVAKKPTVLKRRKQLQKQSPSKLQSMGKDCV